MKLEKNAMRTRRSLLFVPGNNERMLSKALSQDLRCDSVIFDLEDAVPLDQKEKARDLIVRILNAPDNEKHDSLERKELCVRINQLDSDLSKEDVRFFSEVEMIDSFVVPKAEKSGIEQLYETSGKRIIPIIESAKGLLQVESIASQKGVDALTYGCADMALSMRGSIQNYRKNEYLRTWIAVVARGYGLEPIDQVYFNLDDSEGFKNECLEAKGFGYSGKLLIHPGQIEIANRIFSARTVEEIEWARQVVKAYEAALKNGNKGAIRLNRELVDAVHYKTAKEMLESESDIL
jgi:citrate lyase subunit beta / citryl-CoA lyase